MNESCQGIYCTYHLDIQAGFKLELQKIPVRMLHRRIYIQICLLLPHLPLFTFTYSASLTEPFDKGTKHFAEKTYSSSHYAPIAHRHLLQKLQTTTTKKYQ